MKPMSTYRLVDTPHRGIRFLLHKKLFGYHYAFCTITDQRHARLVLVDHISNSLKWSRPGL